MPAQDGRRFLAALAERRPSDATAVTPEATDDDYGKVIDDAIAASEDLESASSFLADRDLDVIETAVERAEADLCGRAGRARDALRSLRSRQAAVDGDRQFRHGRNTPIGGEDIADSR